MNATAAASSPPVDAVRGVADGRDRGDDGSRGDLSERDGVEELGVGHPVVGVHRVALHQRDDHEAAAVGERTDLEGRPAQRREAAGRGRLRHERGERPPVEARGGGRPASHGELGEPAAEQHEHEVRADQGGGGRGRGDVDGPARTARAVAARAVVARADQRARGMQRDRGHRRAGARTGALHPERRRVSEEEHRQRDHEQHRREHEAEPADDRAERAGDAVGAEDRELGRGRAPAAARRPRWRPRTPPRPSSPCARRPACGAARRAPAGHRTRSGRCAATRAQPPRGEPSPPDASRSFTRRVGAGCAERRASRANPRQRGCRAPSPSPHVHTQDA